jgi:hypothetical protein
MTAPKPASPVPAVAGREMSAPANGGGLPLRSRADWMFDPPFRQAYNQVVSEWVISVRAL